MLAKTATTLDAGQVRHRKDFELSPSQRADARAAFARLAGSGISLAAAVEIALAGKRAPKPILADDAAPRFIASRLASGARPATVRWYEDVLGPWLRDNGARTLDEFARPQLLAWINERSAGARPGYLRAIRAFFRWAAAQEPPLVGSDPTIGMTLPRVRRDSAVHFLTVEQCRKLLDTSGRHRAAIALSLFAGVRPDEIAGRGKDWLPWACINEAERIVSIPAAQAKTRKARHVEGLPPAVWAWLASVPADRRGMTVGVSRSRQVGDFGRGVLGLDRWPVDVLRHTFATYGIALTGDAGKVSHWMGHEGDSGTIHRHYRGLATKAQAEAFFGLRP